jgi:protoheme IX farnesyltransferase
MPVKSYFELLKLKIGGMIALTAVVAYLAMADQVSLSHLLMLILVMLLGSSSSAVLNHYYDRDIDRIMSRTAQRPLAVNPHQNGHVLWIAVGLLILGVALAVWVFNPIMALHLFMGAFFYGVVYTVWLKRRSWMNIVLGGLAGSFAVMAGAASVQPELCALPLLLALVLFFWTPSHFWSLAIFLREEYARVHVPMLPVIIGDARTAKVILLNSLMLVGASLLLVFSEQLGMLYLVGALGAGAYLIFNNWRLVKKQTREVACKNFIDSMRYLGMLYFFIVLDVRVF